MKVDSDKPKKGNYWLCVRIDYGCGTAVIIDRPVLSFCNIDCGGKFGATD